MSIVLMAGSAVHFLFTDGISIAFPDFIPLKHGMIYLGGMMELFTAIGLLIPRYSVAAAQLLIAFFMVILPVNIYAGIVCVTTPGANFNSLSLSLLWIRIPIQILFMAWVYYTCIKPSAAGVALETADRH